MCGKWFGTELPSRSWRGLRSQRPPRGGRTFRQSSSVMGRCRRTLTPAAPLLAEARLTVGRFGSEAVVKSGRSEWKSGRSECLLQGRAFVAASGAMRLSGMVGYPPHRNARLGASGLAPREPCLGWSGLDPDRNRGCGQHRQVLDADLGLPRLIAELVDQLLASGSVALSDPHDPIRR